MSQRSNGKYLCDRCGWDVGNAELFNCAVVSDLDGPTVRILHFCRDHEVDGKTVKGCVHYVLSKRNLENYLGENNG
jgi:hypothetical protein